LEALRGADAVVVATEWADFRKIDWVAGAAAMRGTLVYDTRGVVDVEAARAAGLRLERLGRPSADQLEAGGATAASSSASDA
jgi:UDPglucose 6-dehydrogenase